MKVELRQGIFYVKDKEGKSICFNKRYLYNIEETYQGILITLCYPGKNWDQISMKMSLTEFWNFTNA